MSIVEFQHPFQEVQFDIFDWFPNYQACVRFFVDESQHTAHVQALAALINIQLPHQKPQSSSQKSPSLVPYVRRLVVTGSDSATILSGFFGENFSAGIGQILKSERRNYLLAAKSDTWLRVKASYDMEDGQVVPFLRPLQFVDDREIVGAEGSWSDWLAMQDWMIGPREPAD
ncbi:hypothetical protein Golomagni_06036 [Golovinomyces magnicellulatus]|nr:hypothetical protein Golomagni_06036 [Golovinomyces magnicellulatus]